MAVDIPNPPAPGIPYYTPAQYPPAGAAAEDDHNKVPTLFKPIKIRGVEFHNHLWVSYHMSKINYTSFSCIDRPIYAGMGRP